MIIPTSIGIVLLTLTVLFSLSGIVGLIAGFRKGMLWAHNDDFLIVFISVYTFGVIMKYSLIGPEVLRHHLSDVAFPAAVAYFFTWLTTSKLCGHEGYRDMLVLSLQRVNKQQIGFLIGLVLAVGYELVMGAVIASSGKASVGGTSGFDPLDIVAYTLGSLIGTAFLQYSKVGWTNDLKSFDSDIHEYLMNKLS